jgi:hypothetical protein
MEVHPNAEPAAETAEFGSAHQSFWPMHDELYENQEALGPSLYIALAENLGLPREGLIEALEQHSFASEHSCRSLGDQ